MKLAIVTPYAPPEKGAAVTRIVSFADYFQKHGVEVQIFTPKRERLHEGREDARVISYSGKRDLARHFWKEKFDLALATTPPATVTFDALVASKLTRTPLVADVRDPWSYAEAELEHVSSESWTFKKHRLLEKLSYSHSERLFVVSSYLKDLIKSAFDIKDEKIVIVPNGVDPIIFKRDPKDGERIRHELGINNHDPVIVYAGLLGEEKELIDFLKYCGRSIVSDFKAHILFVALLDVWSKKQADELLEISSELGIGENFHLVGPVALEKVCGYLSAGDIGLNPLAEGMSYCLPTKTFEYLACELPIACKAPANGALHDFMKKYDVGFFSSSWTEFKNELHLALNDLENFKNKGERGRGIVGRYYTRERANEIALYEIHNIIK